VVPVLPHTHRWFWDVARPTKFPSFVIIATCGLKAALQKIWDNPCDANIDSQSQDFLQYPLRLSLLALVAREGHTDVVKFLLDKGAHPNPHPELNGMTPLHHASYRGHHDTVKLLVKEGHARILTLLPSPVRYAMNAVLTTGLVEKDFLHTLFLETLLRSLKPLSLNMCCCSLELLDLCSHLQ
jgi:hypothetical protein